jgi:hypothetical protein
MASDDWLRGAPTSPFLEQPGMQFRRPVEGQSRQRRPDPRECSVFHDASEEGRHLAATPRTP